MPSDVDGFSPLKEDTSLSTADERWDLNLIQQLLAEPSMFPMTSVTIISDPPAGRKGSAASSAPHAWQVLNFVAEGNTALKVQARNEIAITEHASSNVLKSLGELALWLDELAESEHDGQSIVISAPALTSLMPAIGEAFPFQAIAVKHRAGTPLSEMAAVQRALFDRGLVATGLLEVESEKCQCFVSCTAVNSITELSGLNRGKVSMSSLGQNGRFANQLFQYAYVKLYALRHGLIAEVPDWEGKHLFNLPDRYTGGLSLPELRFEEVTDDDLILWELDNPPINIDLWGYFQELPPCWRPHRPLLRQIFELAPEQQHAIDAWRDEVTSHGDYTLVAVHVRRGDYLSLQDRAYFRLVPEEWYLSWLRALWPTLRRPVLFVATDEPETVLPQFNEFRPISKHLSGEALEVPGHVFDFQVLRSADLLAICNSSFSRMAAILAGDDQLCFCPSLMEQRFISYEPWSDANFHVRFDGRRQRRSHLDLETARECALGKRLEIGRLGIELKRQSETITRLKLQNANLRQQKAAYERKLNLIKASTSWRLTAPLRRLLQLLRSF